MMTEQMVTQRSNKNRPYYSLVIYCSTSGRMDKIAEAMLPNIRTGIRFVSEDEWSEL